MEKSKTILEKDYMIFSTSCLDGWVSRELDMPNNCLTWYGITMKSFLRLIKEYDDINFDNFIIFNNRDKFLEYCSSLNDEFLFTEGKKVYEHNKNFYGILDKKIIFSTFNYSLKQLQRFSDFNENTQSDIYMTNMYLRRLKYMKNKKPIFLLASSNDSSIKFYNSIVKYPIFFIKKESERTDEVFKNVFYYNDKDIEDCVHNKKVHKDLSRFISDYINDTVNKKETFTNNTKQKIVIKKRNNKIFRPKK
jgi:hypothetical protein